MAASISPVGNGQFFDSDGKPLAGGLVFAYVNGSSSVLQEIFSDTSTPRANPIVLDSGGYVPGTLLLEDGNTYSIVVTKPDGTTVIQNWDNVIPVIELS